MVAYIEQSVPAQAEKSLTFTKSRHLWWWNGIRLSTKGWVYTASKVCLYTRLRIVAADNKRTKTFADISRIWGENLVNSFGVRLDVLGRIVQYLELPLYLNSLRWLSRISHMPMECVHPVVPGSPGHFTFERWLRVARRLHWQRCVKTEIYGLVCVGGRRLLDRDLLDTHPSDGRRQQCWN